MEETTKKTGFMEGFKTLAGIQWYLYLLFMVVLVFVMYKGALSTDLMAFIAIASGISIVFYELGERLPIWNTFIGGGLLMVFFGTAVIHQFGLIPEQYVDMIGEVVSGSTNILTVFIVFLIIGSILSLDRGVLLRSFAGYVPAILGGLAGASILGIVTGLIFGIAPTDLLIKYVLPIMGGGNGAGAVPLSQIYEQVTGDTAANYYSFAIIVLTIANLICIVAAALLNKLGQARPELTGDGTNIMKVDQKLLKEDVKVEVTMDDYRGAAFLGGTAYAIGCLFSKVLLPTVFGAKIHTFAYTIIFVVILAATGIVPKGIRVAAKKMQTFCTGCVGVLLMIGMGVDFDLAELVSVLSPANLIIALVVVVGAIIGSAFVGKLVGFYPIDTAITAGLCMANRGGSGDIAVLGAAHRLELISYAQLSSRLGGGIVLIIASFVFSFFL